MKQPKTIAPQNTQEDEDGYNATRQLDFTVKTKAVSAYSRLSNQNPGTAKNLFREFAAAKRKQHNI